MGKLLDDIEEKTKLVQTLIHELNKHPIYGHMIGTRNSEISGIMRNICDNLLLIQQDIKLLQVMNYKKGEDNNGK